MYMFLKLQIVLATLVRNSDLINLIVILLWTPFSTLSYPHVFVSKFKIHTLGQEWETSHPSKQKSV